MLNTKEISLLKESALQESSKPHRTEVKSLN